MNGKNRLPGVARRMNDIAPFHVMELLTRARQLEAEGRSIVHMEVGEPDFPTPPQVIEAASAFIRGGKVFYTPALGIPALREAIARFYAERYGVKIAPERIAVTAGSSGEMRDNVSLSPPCGYSAWMAPSILSESVTFVLKSSR